MNSRQHLDASDFAKLLGSSTEEFEVLLSQARYDFRYRRLSRKERDGLIIRILNKIESPDLSLAGPEGKARWEKGWRENLENFRNANYSVRELIPKFIRAGGPVRLFGDYVMPYDPNFELNFYTVFRRWLFGRYLAESPAVYEFGCGTAFNLAELAELYPEKDLHGLEWVSAPLGIIDLLRNQKGYRMRGHLFDMFFPGEALDVMPGSAFLAIGALEQLGKNFEAFLNFTLMKKPTLFVHVDSLQELYDENNLSDYLAIKFDRRRNYLQGYVTRMRELASSGRIEILKIQKVSCGGLFHDGYSYIIWRLKSECLPCSQEPRASSRGASETSRMEKRDAVRD